MTCLIKNQEYQTLQKKSGIPDDEFYDICSEYANAHEGRLPELDEIDEADSEQFIKEELNLPETNTITLEDLLEKTGTESIPEATAKLNKLYKDKEVRIIELPNTDIVNIETRPKLYNANFRSDFIPIEKVNDVNYFNMVSNKLLNQYGYSILTVTSKQILELGIENTNAKAFIYNGNIYINAETATTDSAVHEMLHLFLGSLRFDLPELYFNLVNSALQFEHYENLSLKYLNRAKSDVNEEVFVEELAKYLVDMPSEITYLPSEIMYLVRRNVTRMLDTILMGDISTKSLDDAILFKHPLRMIGNYVLSSLMENGYHCTLNPKNAFKHRQLANLREELLKSGDLKELCI